MRRNVLRLTTSIALASGYALAGEWDLGATIGADTRIFLEDPALPGQFDEALQPSITFEADIRWESESGNDQFVFVPYGRLDGQDDERTHFDIREAYYRRVGDDFEVLVGAQKVFWGVTESRHLVDVINQTDGVEDIDEEDKLGQPMVKATFFRDWGQIDLFYLPYFRERTFPGIDGRLRPPILVETDVSVFDNSDEEWSASYAARYSHYVGNWDVSVNAFHGTSREPLLEPYYAVTGNTVGLAGLRPRYDEITQLGVTAQYTNEAWLWKFEGIGRAGQGDTFAAAVAGFEYTFFGVTEGGADLGVLVEAQYDGRNQDFAPPTPADNDIFVGARLGFNDIQDTAVLAGVITDVEDGSMAGLVEAERRFGENWTGSVEARFFANVDDQNLLAAFKKDSHITVGIKRYF